MSFLGKEFLVLSICFSVPATPNPPLSPSTRRPEAREATDPPSEALFEAVDPFKGLVGVFASPHLVDVRRAKNQTLAVKK